MLPAPGVLERPAMALDALALGAREKLFEELVNAAHSFAVALVCVGASTGQPA